MCRIGHGPAEAVVTCVARKQYGWRKCRDPQGIRYHVVTGPPGIPSRHIRRAHEHAAVTSNAIELRRKDFPGFRPHPIHAPRLVRKVRILGKQIPHPGALQSRRGEHLRLHGLLERQVEHPLHNGRGQHIARIAVFEGLTRQSLHRRGIGQRGHHIGNAEEPALGDGQVHVEVRNTGHMLQDMTHRHRLVRALQQIDADVVVQVEQTLLNRDQDTCSRELLGDARQPKGRSFRDRFAPVALHPVEPLPPRLTVLQHHHRAGMLPFLMQ